jgi:hypothetical protein
VNISIFGLMGCICFLLMTRLSERVPLLQNPTVVFIGFLILVISPWVGIILSYCRSIRAVEVSQTGVGFATRLSAYKLGWPEVAKVYLAYSDDPTRPDLRLVVIPKDESAATIEIDMNQSSSPIRARTHLINEIVLHYGPVPHRTRQSLELSSRKAVIFR